MYTPTRRVKLSVYSQVVIGLYAASASFWFLFVVHSRYSPTLEGWIFNYLLTPFLVGMTILPLISGVFGIRNALGWGGFKSLMGRSTLGIGLGLIAWGGGMVIWNWYLFFGQVEVPYPSAADFVFALSWPLWTYGLYQLAKIIGIPYALRNQLNRVFLVLITLTVAVIALYLVIVVARDGITYENPQKLFFDLFYPLGDVVILAFTVLVYFFCRKALGGVYKTPILILFAGFIMNFISDFMFSYTTTQGTYFNGHYVDFLFVTTMFVLSLGLSMLSTGERKR